MLTNPSAGTGFRRQVRPSSSMTMLNQRLRSALQ
jgi:hypothetical protein